MAGLDKSRIQEKEVYHERYGNYTYVSGIYYNGVQYSMSDYYDLPYEELQIQEIHPYDDAHYYWARYKEKRNMWFILYNGTIVEKINGDTDWEQIIPILRNYNKNVNKRMIYN